MSDAFWKEAFANAPAIIGAIFAGLAMLVSLLNGRKANKAVVKMEAVSQEVSATKEIAKEAVAKTVTLHDRQTVMAQSLQTNTLYTQEIQAAIAGFSNSKPGALS